jgi:hypothetical protein
MILKIFRSVFFLLLAFAQLPFSLRGQTLEPAAYGPNRIEIPYEFAGGHMIAVVGSVGSHKNLQFLVDFGTTYTLLDRQVVSERADGEKLEIRHFSDAIQSSDTLVPELAIGPLVIKNLHAYVVDMAQIPAAPPGTSGVIGLDILQRQNVTIDFLEKKLVLSSAIYGNHQAPLLKCDSGFAVSASWKGLPVKLVLSTGVEVVTVDEERIKQKAIKLHGLKKTSLSSNFTIVPVSIFETKDMTLNEMQLSGPGVLRKMAWPYPNDELDGFLPLLALHASRVSVDFDRNLLLWDGVVSAKEIARMTHQPVPRQSLKP